MGKGDLSGSWEGCKEKGTRVLGLFRMNKSWPWKQGGEQHSRLKEQHVQFLELRSKPSQGMWVSGGAGSGRYEGFRAGAVPWRSHGLN